MVHKVLLKAGADDLRQDAVMEQIFCLVNTLLAQNTEARNKALLIRTYNVVVRASFVVFVSQLFCLNIRTFLSFFLAVVSCCRTGRMGQQHTVSHRAPH